MKILVIEDVRVERKILKQWLEEAGYEVIEAANGVEGLARYHEDLPDLVITDIVMPEKEGIELMIDLVKAAPDLKIFAMSGAGKNKIGEYLPLAKCVGAIRTFNKPIDKVELLKAIAQLFPRSTSAQATP